MDGILTRRNHDGKGHRWFARPRWCRLFAPLVLAAGTATAAPAKVALVHDPEPNALQQKTLTRLRAELGAAGFDVTDIEQRGADAREAAESDPAAEGAFATIAVVLRTGDAADIWVADRITGKTVVRRVQAPPSAGRDVAAILAVRAVELLQASLLEALEPLPRETPATTSPAPPEPPPAALPSDVAGWMQARRTSRAPRFELQAGLGLVHSFDGIGPAFLPVLGLSYRLTSNLLLGLRAGGPAFAADLRTPGGTIAVHQALALFEVVYELGSPDAIVRPLAVAGVGAYHLDVVGSATPPYHGESGAVWAAAWSLGPGAKVRLGERVSVLADVRLLFLLPQPVVRAANEDAGSMSRPSLFGETAIDVSF